MSILVVQCVALIQKPRLYRESGRRMRRRLQFDGATLADDQRFGITDLERARHQALDRDHGHGSPAHAT